MKNYQPPKIAQFLLKRIFSEFNHTSIGDFEEVFRSIAADYGNSRAKLWYWLQLIVSIKSFIFGKIYWSIIMFKNYLTITFRKMFRQKGYTFINISGLALGLACSLLIIAYITTELSYDKYHKNADRIFRLGTEFNVGTMKGKFAVSNLPIGPILKKDYPEVVNAARFRRFDYRTLVAYQNKTFFEENIFFSDNSVFEIFTYPFLKGDPKTALAAAYSIVVTEDVALKYFGTEDPIGKQLQLANGEKFSVTGVIKNIPDNSHFYFNMLCSFETFRRWNDAQMERWMGDFNNYTYILLKDNTDYTQLEQKFPPLIEANVGELLQAVGGTIDFFLQPLTDIHLRSNTEGEISATSDIVYIYIFALIAFFILLIACINFMNLTTARSTNRAKEVGMRKVLGANRGRLISQFLGESLIYSFLALCIALLVVRLALPHFSSIAGINLDLDYTKTTWLIPGLLGITIFVGILAGSYPALFLSAFRPAEILGGNIKTGKTGSGLRDILVIFQFTISIVLITGTLIILNQINYMKNKKPGFDKEHVVVLPVLDNSIRESIESIKTELQKNPGILDIAFSSHIPSHGARHNAFVPEGYTNEESKLMAAISIDNNFLETLKIELVKGRNFSPGFATDPRQSVIINETAAQDFGWDNPIGKTIRELDGQQTDKTVIGVVKDFHFKSLHQKIDPLFIENNSSYFSTVSIRINPTDISGTIKNLEKKWRQIDPTGTFDYLFLNEEFDSQYRGEERLSTLFLYFTLLAILIACLGLLGLASFNAEQKTKEIGIRKVVGASTTKIVLLLSKKFMTWIIIANIVAWPIAYLLMTEWLQNFAYQAKPGFNIFLLSGIFALIIAMLTVSYQSVKAALANPVNSLKYE